MMTFLSAGWSMQVTLLKRDQESDTSSSTKVKDTMERWRMQGQEGDDERDGDEAITATNNEGSGKKGADGDQDDERDGDEATTANNNEGNGEKGADGNQDREMAAE